MNLLGCLDSPTKGQYVLNGSDVSRMTEKQLAEIRNKEIQKVEYIFLSSLFKKNTNYLGINKFNNISKFTKKKIVALGGISRENLKKLKLVHCSGFSGISYFE